MERLVQKVKSVRMLDMDSLESLVAQDQMDQKVCICVQACDLLQIHMCAYNSCQLYYTKLYLSLHVN